ncbi:hypothetical protein EDC04DRAFT_2988074 [Pisolithus marmoratus]|nr:hypothetical protein EDC04DRAFT_2988074 [Pisolithus marmoratus]
MRLLDVATMLNLERGFDEEKNVPRMTKVLKEFYGPDLAEKEYAILSHCWGVEKEGEQEVLFEDMKQLLIMSDEERKGIRGRTGYKKIVDTCRRARKDGLEWVWIDTCCINKESSSELSEAINSMYKWYANAELCYAYLHDTLGDSWTKQIESRATPKWFSRGWTLQELIAPKVVYFLDQEWERIGNKVDLALTLSQITRIPAKVLKEGLQKALSSGKDFERPSVAQIISWAADRTTTREEDRAYSLLGLLGVHMPMLYGEGKNAFRRLQLEIIRMSNDQSIFAWGWRKERGWSSNILADDPSYFWDCDEVTALKPDEFTRRLREEGVADDELSKSPQKRLRTFMVTNDGIQIWLPIATAGPFSQVTLACKEEYSILITIHLLFRGSTCFRIFGLPKYPGKMAIKQHLLPYKEAEYPSPFTFELHDQTLSHDGFGVDHDLSYGIEVKDGSITLSNDNDCAAIAYVRGKDDTRFLVLLGYCGGRHVAFAILPPKDFWPILDPEDSEDFERDLEFLRFRVFERLFNSNHEPTYCDKHLMQHIHFRQSIEGVRVVHSVSYDSLVHCTVTVDIAKCFGCCTHEECSTNDLVETPRTPGVMWNCLLRTLPQTRDLSENYPAIPLSLMESELQQPGDYGRVPQGGDKFRPEGNIIEFAIGVKLDPIQDDIRGIHPPELATVESTVSLARVHPERSIFSRLNLYDVTSWSLPANQQVVSLLNALSSRLSGRLLVTTVIRCSDRCHLRPGLHSTSTPWGGLDLEPWQTLDTPTPLCSVMMPLAWCQIDSDWELMTMLLKIIDNFSALVGWVDRLDDPKHLTESVTVENAIEFFVDMFGGGDIRNFTGDIVFFSKIPRIMEIESHTERAIGMDKGRYPTPDITGGSDVTGTAFAQRVNALVMFLTEIGDGTFNLQLCPKFVVQVGSGRIGWTKLWKNGLGWRSAPFAIEVLELFDTLYKQCERQDTKFDRRTFLIEVEQIKKWRELLIGTNNEHERRALLEDTVGKVTLLMTILPGWLAEVVDRYISDGPVGHKRIDRVHRLSNIGGVFRQAIDHIPDEGLNPLRRIMDDAVHRVSKHQLLLTERAKLAFQSNEARHTLKRKRETSVSVEPPSPVQVKR